MGGLVSLSVNPSFLGISNKGVTGKREGRLHTNDSTTIPLCGHCITVDSVDDLFDGLERCAEDSEGGEFLRVPISRSVGWGGGGRWMDGGREGGRNVTGKGVRRRVRATDIFESLIAYCRWGLLLPGIHVFFGL